MSYLNVCESRPQGGMDGGAGVPVPVEGLAGIVGCRKLAKQGTNIVPPLYRDCGFATVAPVMYICYTHI